MEAYRERDCRSSLALIRKDTESIEEISHFNRNRSRRELCLKKALDTKTTQTQKVIETPPQYSLRTTPTRIQRQNLTLPHQISENFFNSLHTKENLRAEIPACFEENLVPHHQNLRGSWWMYEESVQPTVALPGEVWQRQTRLGKQKRLEALTMLVADQLSDKVADQLAHKVRKGMCLGYLYPQTLQ